MPYSSKLMPSLRLLCLVPVAAGFIAAGPAAAEELKMIEHATTDAVTDTGAKGDSAGDILTFANDVYDEANANKVGTSNGYCVRIVQGQAWDCSFSVTLSDGQIMLSGPFLDGKDSTMSIVGGTGRYKSSRGEMQLHARDDKGSAYDFTFLFSAD